MQVEQDSHISFIGLGNMGRGMCRNLVCNHLWTPQRVNKMPLTVFNRTISRAEALQAEMPDGSVQIASSIHEAVKCSDIIITCLSDDDAVQQVLDEALGSTPVGKLFVECSTIHPLRTQALCNQVLQANARFVACPVFGAPDRADKGQLVGVVAGPRSDIDYVKPWFDGVIGRAVIDLGNHPTQLATTLKVIGNSFIFNMVEAVAEGHVLAEKTGLGGDALHEYLTLFFPGVYASYSSRIMKGDYWNREEPLFLASLARKDARHAMSLAQAVGTLLPALEIADRNLAKVVERKGDKGDYVGIYGVLRQEAGLKYEN
ncbi:uncharacterized protein N7484_000405 [Penicillium longicatenatum]|uniref:uncharacterized protein n=1 Tax=Penicillium longicatenatum TaxID=1561947 RepID=UPI002547B528|nr:uncharacterized protein N7484_000405 [Penicillium longicatenatum]KAJ5661033.1 hypothetical protein N7484_000405 [Penicillium longicatenatum]